MRVLLGLRGRLPYKYHSYKYHSYSATRSYKYALRSYNYNYNYFSNCAVGKLARKDLFAAETSELATHA